MTMGEYIKKLRTDRGWSQEELGKKVGVNRAAVNKWETGTVENIKRTTIKRLSEVFGVTPCELMCWNDEPKPEPVVLDPEEQRLVEQFKHLDDVDRQRLLERLSTMLEAEKYEKRRMSSAEQKIS